MVRRVRITQLDGKLPNMALMKLAHWHRAQGDEITFTRRADRDLFEPDYDVVYGSAIFERTAPIVERFRAAWPGAIVGGTWNDNDLITVESVIGVGLWEYEHYDYSDWPSFSASIGMTQRGCRMRCGFCKVPRKEGRPAGVNTIADIWRGAGHPKHIHLLDNDFFGNPDWRDRIAEMRDGGFKICMNQGFNIRLVSEENAAALASIEYRDDQFRERRLYTAWDNLGDERVFFRGVDRLEGAGVPPKHLRAYMLVGFNPGETFEQIRYRFDRMVARGIEPYPMVFDCRADYVCNDATVHGNPEWYHTLKQFQRWVITGLYRAKPFEEYDGGYKRERIERKAARLKHPQLFEEIITAASETPAGDER